MSSLWDIEGANIDQGYANLRVGQSRTEIELRAALSDLWVMYEPYADKDFRGGFARDPEARFWEMYLGCTFLEAGKTLLQASERRRRGGKPDLCVIEEDGRRVWIEAIVPDLGQEGPDQVRRPTPLNQGGRVIASPVRETQLRITSALWTKTKVIKGYLQSGVIAAKDVRLIAIGGGRFGPYASEYPLPLMLSCVFPIGQEYAKMDIASGDVTEQGFEPSFEIVRQGPAIPRTAFIDPTFADVSGAIWSRLGLGAWSRVQSPLTLVHNPLANVALEERWYAWDREFVPTPDGEERWVATDILADDSDGPANGA